MGQPVTRYLKCTLLHWMLSSTTAYVYSPSGHIYAVYYIHTYVHMNLVDYIHWYIFAWYTLTLHLCMTEELLSSPLICCFSGVPLRSHILYIDNGGTMWSSLKLDILKNQLCDTWHKRACAHTHAHLSLPLRLPLLVHCQLCTSCTCHLRTHPSVDRLCCMLCSLDQ